MAAPLATTNQVDTKWDDGHVFVAPLKPDSLYLFDRMTVETLGAIEAKPGQNVLDVGCGRGHDLLSLASSGALLFGFDGSVIMGRKTVETFAAGGQAPRVIIGAAEGLPFSDESFDWIFCKGAIDHFYDPKQAMQEMARITKVGGSVIISVANFDNPGFRLGRWLDKRFPKLFKPKADGKRFWDKPDDHVCEFSHSFLTGLVPANMKITLDVGVSMFWGFPKWGRLLEKLPPRVALVKLKFLDRLAHAHPSWGDVLIIRAKRII